MNFLSELDEFNTSNKKYEKFNGFMVVTKRVDGSGLLYSDEEIITRALMNPYGNNLFTVKSYMSETNVKKSHILAGILRYQYFFTKAVDSVEINDIMIAIAFLNNTLEHNKETYLPDRKLSIILKTNRQNCHKILFKLQGLFPNIISIYQRDGILRIKIDKELLNADSLINQISEHLKSKHTKRITKKEKKKALLKFKNKEINWDNLRKRELRNNLYYNNGNIYNKTIARICFKEIVLGISYWWTRYVIKYYLPDTLNNHYNEVGERQDIIYLYIPVDIISAITGLDEQEIRTRIYTTMHGMGGYLYKHNRSYFNITNENDNDFKPVKKEIYEDNTLLRRSTMCSEIKVTQKRLEEIQLAEIQKYPVTIGSSFIFDTKYLNTKIGRKIQENKNVYLYIIKKFLTYHYDEVIRDNSDNKFYLPKLTEEQQRAILEELSDINLKDYKLKKQADRLINKDKLSSLPKIEMREKRNFSYQDCLQKDEYGRFIKKSNLEKISNRYDRKITDSGVEYYKRNADNILDLCMSYSQEEIDAANKDTIKTKEPIQCVYIIKKLIEQFNSASKYNLGYSLNQVKLGLNHLVTGFSLYNNTNKMVKFLKLIKSYSLGQYFIEYEEARPYLQFIL